MKIGNTTIGDNRTFIIAEIGNNHNGSMERAKRLVDHAKKCGVDCVKFQLRHLSAVYRSKTLSSLGDDLGVEYTIDLLKRFELSVEEHKKLKQYVEAEGLIYMCTPWDEISVEVLEDFGVKAYKIASADLTNVPLLERVTATKKPMILSTGMSTESEIETIVDFLNSKAALYALLHCNSTYPAPFADINLNWLQRLKCLHPIVGYSGHERGVAVSVAAVGVGAQIIERHLTLDRNMEGPDHAASLEPSEFRTMVEGIRQVEAALGNGMRKEVSQGEMINRENLGKSIVAKRTISIGEKIQLQDVEVRSPGQGLSPLHLEKLLNSTAKRSIDIGDFFFDSDLSDVQSKARDYRMKSRWGVPVRFHDYEQFKSLSNFDLVEFHLSFSDMELPIENYIREVSEKGFVVHAPELFKGSLLLDLASSDRKVREASIAETQRVIEITRDLKFFFPKEINPLIVVNIGGYSMDVPINEEAKSKAYEHFAESLTQLTLEGVELIPQTMAPFPWHFGGQRHQNLFVHPGEIVEHCERLGIRMCLDISHSYLTCNHFNLDFFEFVKQVAPYTAHLHLGDAKGVNGEGLQIGQGEIDFVALSECCEHFCKDASFIPEIWQGHKNGGEGFWAAMEKLEGLF